MCFGDGVDPCLQCKARAEGKQQTSAAQLPAVNASIVQPPVTSATMEPPAIANASRRSLPDLTKQSLF